jgi:hypothetical protein
LLFVLAINLMADLRGRIHADRQRGTKTRFFEFN